MGYVFENFRPYLILYETTIFTDHSTIRYLFNKQDENPRLTRWVLLLLQFDIQLREKKEWRMLRIIFPIWKIWSLKLNVDEIDDNFPKEYVMVIIGEEPWYANIVNYLARSYRPKGLSHQQNKKLFFEIKYYFWDDPYLFRSCLDGIVRRCVFG